MLKDLIGEVRRGGGKGEEEGITGAQNIGSTQDTGTRDLLKEVRSG